MDRKRNEGKLNQVKTEEVNENNEIIKENSDPVQKSEKSHGDTHSLFGCDKKENQVMDNHENQDKPN